MPSRAAKSLEMPAAVESARARLLSQAIELFNRKGYATTTVREIVEAAGVTKPVLYYYFGNKEGLFLELMQSGWTQFAQVTEEACRSRGSPWQRLLRLCDCTFAWCLENMGVVRLMNSIYYGPPQGAPYFDFHAFHAKFQDAVTLLVKEGVTSGQFRRGNLQHMTWSILGAVNIAMDVEIAHPELSLGREGLGRVLRTIFTGLAANAGRARRNHHV